MDAYRKSWAEYAMKKIESKIFLYLPGSTIKGPNYDKFRDTGYQKAYMNPQCVKGWLRDTAPNEFIARQLGKVATGTKKAIVKNNDVSLFMLANRIVIKDVDYSLYSEATGNRLQILPLDDDYTEVTLYIKNPSTTVYS